MRRNKELLIALSRSPLSYLYGKNAKETAQPAHFSLRALIQRYPLLATFILSLAIHLILISSFHVRIWLPQDIFTLSTPTTIALDIDLLQYSESGNPLSLITEKGLEDTSIDEEITLLQMKGISSLEQISLFAASQFPSAFVEIVESSDQQKEDIDISHTSAKDKSSRTLQLPSFMPWTTDAQEVPSFHPIRIYPLKLSFFHGVKSLDLIDDASSLFTQANESTVSLTPGFAEMKPTVEFFIEIDPETGKIRSWSCVKELVDKRLQSLSHRILKTLRFRIPEFVDKKSLSGAISIQFNGNYDVIAQRVAWDIPR